MCSLKLKHSAKEGSPFYNGPSSHTKNMDPAEWYPGRWQAQSGA